jgi:hypothetical protein
VCLNELAQLATVVGAPVGVGALIYAGIQLQRTLRVERGRFMLELERMIAVHDATHYRLRPGGDWAGPNAKAPQNLQEWAQLEDYMGFFEHCELLLKDRALDLPSFKSLFGFRVENIVANQSIVQTKLVEEGKYWNEFRHLAKRLNLELPPVAS